MSNPNKHKSHFYVFFKNMPYSDEEWERDTKWRQERSEGLFFLVNRQDYRPRAARPCHPIKMGPAVASHEAARKVCEAALASGAQMAHYSVHSGTKWPGTRESWAIRKGGDWYQVK